MLEIDIIKRRGPLLIKPLQLRLPVLKPALPEHIRRADQARRANAEREVKEVRHAVDSGDIAAFIARSRQAAVDALLAGEYDFAWSELDAD